MEMICRHGSSLLDGRQVAKAIRLYSKDRIEFAAEIFQSNNCGQLYQLLIREMPLQTQKEANRYPFPRIGHPLG